MAKSERRVRVARALKALAHPGRLVVVEALSKREHCVCDLQEIMGLDLSTVSRHLKLLADAGIVEYERQGKKVIYRLKTPCIGDFVACIDSVLAGEPCKLVATASSK
jgi:ArsR family transcriptional regulator